MLVSAAQILEIAGAIGMLALAGFAGVKLTGKAPPRASWTKK